MLAGTQGKIENLIAFISKGDKSEYIPHTLRGLEATARDQAAAIRRLERAAGRPVALPSPDELMGSVLDVEAAFTEDPILGRQRLHGLFKDRRIDLTPVDGIYVARSALLPLMALQEAENYTGDPGGGRRYMEVVAGAHSSTATY